jgi:RNA polymerase sigma factor (sigma-70 family)
MQTAPAIELRPEQFPTDRSLVRRFRVGSSGAAEQLYRRYSDRIRTLVRSNLSRGLCRRLEADDIVQSVFRRFFEAARQGRYLLPAGEELWDLLAVIALNRLRSEEQFHRAGKRDLRRTVGLEALVMEAKSGRGPTETLDTVLTLAVDEVLGRLPTHYREVVRLRMEGYGVAEIAVRISRSKRTVERMLQEVQTRLRSVLNPEQ